MLDTKDRNKERQKNTQLFTATQLHGLEEQMELDDFLELKALQGSRLTSSRERVSETGTDISLLQVTYRLKNSKTVCRWDGSEERSSDVGR